jgi:hypothetical protein
MKFSTGVITLLVAASLLSSSADGQSVKVGTCTEEAPCEECTGDCKFDTDCVDDLVCFHQYGRSDKEDGDRVTIPGCNMIGTYIMKEKGKHERRIDLTLSLTHSLTRSIKLYSFVHLIVHLDFSKADWCVDPKNLSEDYEEQQKDDEDEKDVPGDDDDADGSIGGQTNIGTATCRSGGLQLFPFVGEDSAQRMLLRQEVIDSIPANLCNITDDPERKRKNVILVIGDGMGWEMTRSGAIAKQVLDELKSLGCDTTTGCPDNQDAIDAFKGRSLDDYYTEGKNKCS